jgi:hypothetical protein
LTIDVPGRATSDTNAIIMGVFNKENLFARGRDFRLGSFATDAFRASVE